MGLGGHHYRCTSANEQVDKHLKVPQVSQFSRRLAILRACTVRLYQFQEINLSSTYLEMGSWCPLAGGRKKM